ncbi:MAG: SDR family oxidoreductase [Acidimicrobiaceae bacterium]|nr:SDR family oxidoreductase [Acidimicrobiaceae bacterium]
MDLGIANRRALVTGGSQGLGLGTAVALADEGVKVVIASRSQEKLDKAMADHPSIFGSVVADLSTPAGVENLIGSAQSQLGGIDIVVLNAGGPKAGGYRSASIQDIEAALNQNLLSMISVAQGTVEPMIQSGWGRILAITSLWVRQPGPNLILSNTSRSALTAYLKTLATEVAADGVTVNTIQPGLHKTDRLIQLHGGDPSAAAASLPSKSFGDPYDFGKVAAFLLSEQAKYVNGSSLWVDGGLYAGLM